MADDELHDGAVELRHEDRVHLRVQPLDVGHAALERTEQILRVVDGKQLGVGEGNVTELYVDTVGNQDYYEKKLQILFPNIACTVRKKADFIYPIVSAASIGANKTDMSKAIKNKPVSCMASPRSASNFAKRMLK